MNEISGNFRLPQVVFALSLVAGLAGCQSGSELSKPGYETDSLKPFPVLKPVPEYLSRNRISCWWAWRP